MSLRLETFKVHPITSASNLSYMLLCSILSTPHTTIPAEHVLLVSNQLSIMWRAPTRTSGGTRDYKVHFVMRREHDKRQAQQPESLPSFTINKTWVKVVSRIYELYLQWMCDWVFTVLEIVAWAWSSKHLSATRLRRKPSLQTELWFTVSYLLELKAQTEKHCVFAAASSAIGVRWRRTGWTPK